MKYYRKKKKTYSRYRPRTTYRKKIFRKYPYKRYRKTSYRRPYRSYRKSRYSKSLKGKTYKRSGILSGAEIMAKIQVINEYWVLYSYDIGRQSVLMYGEMVKSLIGKIGYLQQPHYMALKLYKQNKDTPLFYAFMGDNFTSEYICNYINNSGLTKFLSDSGVRTRPWLTSLIQGERNDACFKASNMMLYVILPSQVSEYKQMNPQPYPSTYKGPKTTGDGINIGEIKDYFDFKLTCGYRWHFDTCSKKVIKEMPSFEKFAAENSSDPNMVKLNKEYNDLVSKQGKEKANSYFDSLLYGMQVVGDTIDPIVAPARDLASRTASHVISGMLYSATHNAIQRLTGRVPPSSQNQAISN
jgi:hypothetical protein